MIVNIDSRSDVCVVSMIALVPQEIIGTSMHRYVVCTPEYVTLVVKSHLGPFIILYPCSHFTLDDGPVFKIIDVIKLTYELYEQTKNQTQTSTINNANFHKTKLTISCLVTRTRYYTR